jgi:hypothetical protein
MLLISVASRLYMLVTFLWHLLSTNVMLLSSGGLKSLFCMRSWQKQAPWTKVWPMGLIFYFGNSCIDSLISQMYMQVATFVIQKILLDDSGLRFVCATAHRFFSVTNVLATMVTALVNEPSTKILKHVIRCYLRLTYDRRYVRISEICFTLYFFSSDDACLFLYLLWGPCCAASSLS